MNINEFDLRRETIILMNQKMDPENLLGTTLKFPCHIEKTIEMSRKWNISPIRPQNVVIIGMGGSAIGGDLIRTYVRRKADIPVIVIRDYNIPSFVGANTLSIICSYSGNTEETLSAYKNCVEKNAYIISISAGGELELLSKENGSLHLRIPGGLQPRAAIGYLFSALFIIFSKLYIGDLDINDLIESSNFLKNTIYQWSSQENNLPFKLALKIKDKIPIFQGISGFLETVAYRWKCQFNENSKLFAAYSSYPELNHNEIVGLTTKNKSLHQISVIILIDPDCHEKTARRIALTKEMMKKSLSVYEVEMKGETEIQKLLYSILYGDLLSIYTAYLHGQNPAQIEVIHKLKTELANNKGGKCEYKS